MELSNKEQELKDELQNKSVELDFDVWDTIADRVPKKKKSRKLWYMLASVFIFVGVLLYGLFSSVSTNTNAVNTQVSKNTSLNTSSNIEYNVETQKLDETNEEEKGHPKTQNTSRRESLGDLNNTKPVVKEITENSLKLDEKVSKITSINKEVKANLNSQPTKIRSISEPKLSTNSDIKRRLISNRTKLTRTSLAGLTSLLPNRATLPSLSLLLSPVDNDHPIDHKQFTLSPFSISIGLGTTQLLSQPNVREGSKFDQQILDQVLNLQGLNTSLALSYDLGKGTKLRLGVSYKELITRYSNDRIYTYNSSISDTMNVYTAANMFEQTETGLVDARIIQHEDVRLHNKLTRVEIDLGLAKRIISINAFSLEGELGLSYPIISNESGYYFNETTEGIQTYRQVADKPYQTKQSLQYFLGIGLNYNRKNISIGLRSTYTQGFSNLYEQNNFYNQKNTQLGLQFCTTYRPSWEIN